MWKILMGGMMLTGLWGKTSLQAEPSKVVETLSIKVEIQIGTGLENRKLVGGADTFDESVDQVVAWTLIKGAKGPMDIQHVWLYQGKEKSFVMLPIKSSHFRTHSRKTIKGLVGRWTLQVKDGSGTILGSKNFAVTSGKGKPTNP